MVGTFQIVMNVLMVAGLIGISTMIVVMFKLRRVIKENSHNPDVKGISINRGHFEVILSAERQLHDQRAKAKEQAKLLVRDDICYKEIEKNLAYRIINEDKEYFFCSWECRRKFIEQRQNDNT